MKVRSTNVNDVDAVLAIVEEAQAFFKKNGIPQWQDGHPNRESILTDIRQGISYVLEDGDGHILATSVLQFTPEPTYNKIYDGSWLMPEDSYAAIHRVAAAGSAKGTGAAGHLYQALEEKAKKADVRSVRVDTHRVNLAMQRFLKKNGFEKCGVIFLDDGSERIAFEKLL